MLNKPKVLYLSIFLLMIGTVITALGGGLFGQSEPWFAQWQHQAFTGLCHQNPARSFWIDGQPMAVCSRCFGVYLGLLIGWLSFPIAHLTGRRLPGSDTKILLAAIAINLVDVFVNMAGFWQNTLVSRFILGIILGGAVIHCIVKLLIQHRKKGYYGYRKYRAT